MAGDILVLGFHKTVRLMCSHVHKLSPSEPEPRSLRSVAARPRLTGVGPLIGVSEMRVIVGNVSQDFLCQVGTRGEIATAQNPPRQHPKPNLNLVQPTPVLGSEMH